MLEVRYWVGLTTKTFPLEDTWNMIQAAHVSDHDVRYRVDASADIHGGLKAAAADAEIVWESKLKNRGYTLIFTEVSSGEDVLIDTYAPSEGICGIAPALACLMYTISPTTGHIIGTGTLWVESPPATAAKDGSTVILRWTLDPNHAELGPPGEFRYLPSVIMHEFGHAAGLQHPPNVPHLREESIMISGNHGKFNTTGKFISWTTPLDYDIAGMDALYTGHVVSE